MILTSRKVCILIFVVFRPFLLKHLFIFNVIFIGYTDNKHGFVQMEILAVEHSELTVVIELMNGQYYQDFDKNIPDQSDIWVHSPNRASYNKHNYQQDLPSRNAFLTLLDFTTLNDANIGIFLIVTLCVF
jgi:hypothetical protein